MHIYVVSIFVIAIDLYIQFSGWFVMRYVSLANQTFVQWLATKYRAMCFVFLRIYIYYIIVDPYHLPIRVNLGTGGNRKFFCK